MDNLKYSSLEKLNQNYFWTDIIIATSTQMNL